MVNRSNVFLAESFANDDISYHVKKNYKNKHTHKQTNKQIKEQTKTKQNKNTGENPKLQLLSINL